MVTAPAPARVLQRWLAWCWAWLRGWLSRCRDWLRRWPGRLRGWVRAWRVRWRRGQDRLRACLAQLARSGVALRVALVIAAGAALSVGGGWRSLADDGVLWAMPIMAGFVAYGVFKAVLILLAVLVELGDRFGPLAALGVLALPMAGIGWLCWVLGLNHGGALPAGFVLLFGGWVCLLVDRRVRSSPRAWLRHVTDVLVAVFLALAIVVGFSQDLVTTQPAAVLLFPVAGWAAVRTWRAMAGSGRLAVRAAADIVLSLLLGADLVLFLVWLANLLELPPGEVSALRAVLARAGAVTDVPWWVWVALYVLLAAVSLLLALRPDRLAAPRRRWERLRVPSVVDVTRRVQGGVHIGLMVAVLIGAAAPGLVVAAVNGHVRPRYAVAAQQQLAAAAELAAYQEIARTFRAPASVPHIHVLPDLFRRIHRTDPPRPGSDATGTERSLARRLGRVQATAVVLEHRAAPVGPDTEPAEPAEPTWFDQPVGGADDLRQRLADLTEQRARAATTTARVQQAADLAANAIAGTVQAADLGGSELVQLAKEYLQGLIEGSPLKDLLARWAGRRTGTDPPPPPAERLVEPDPVRLLIAAYQVRLQVTLTVRLADPLTPDPVLARARQESPLDAAVDLTNEARYLQERTGPCAGCPQPLRPGEEPRLGPERGGREPPPEHPRIPIR